MSTFKKKAVISRRYSLGFALGTVFWCSGDPIVFNRDIRPILSENCFHCHGPDPGSRKAALRLDTREGVFGVREKSGAPVIPGKAEVSELYRRLVSDDKDVVMPPPDSHRKLKPEQVGLLKRWIESGAPWQSHWSFIKPVRPAIPATESGAVNLRRNPIDAFISRGLSSKGLTMNPEADRRTLARRLSLDVTGLPPSPADVDAFVGDSHPQAYERYLTRLMDSPRWGEHRGRYWLDAARYADTHGLHFDNYREMWPYRDWVIAAFNRNQPFDQFTIEQIAGDLLPNPSDDQMVATGFHRCNMTTNEGGTIEEENLAFYANDRVSTTSWVWLGLTANCAACHDHKFDPVSMRDFYSMAAFFRNTVQGGLDGNVKDSNPSMVVVRDPASRTRWERIPGEMADSRRAIDMARTNAQPAFEAWAGTLKPGALAEELETGIHFHARLTGGSNEPVRIKIASVSRELSLPAGVNWTDRDKGKLGPAPIIGEAANVAFPEAGDFEWNQPFSFGGWIFVPSGFNEDASLFARMDTATGYRGWDLWHQQGGQIAAHFVHQWPANALKVRTVERFAKKAAWQHIMVTYDGTGRPEGVRIYWDGISRTTEMDGARGITGSMRTAVPFTLATRTGGGRIPGAGFQDIRIYSRVMSAAEVRALSQEPVWEETFSSAFETWKKEVRDDVFQYFLAQKDAGYRAANQQFSALEQERQAIRIRNPVTHVQREKMESMPVARILNRGQYDQPRDTVTPEVFAALGRLPAEAPRNRLGLARWLISGDNPLVARVTVNRFWQEIFGTGLVKTSDDFGIMGEAPSHPELLDWLAVDFQESGWDVKRLFTMILTSAAYRQSSAATTAKLELDPANRFLSRGPRFRMDAEVVRDYALAASGILVEKLGGPSVKPYQPGGVWESVAMPESNTKYYKRDAGESLYRRSVYTFWKRAAPPALLDVFNAPSREVSCLRRERTSTPLQALATLNDPTFFEAGRVLAGRVLAETGGDVSRTLSGLSGRILSRPLREPEAEVVRELVKTLERHYANHPGEAEELLKLGESPLSHSLSKPQWAAWTLAANQLLNLDECLNK